MPKIVIVGGGAAGIFAAIGAAELGAPVVLFEKNAQLGKKILITGNGRCNLTNIKDIQYFFKEFPGNGSFLHSAFKSLSNLDLIKFFNGIGITTKVEDKGRVFPKTDRAQDVVQALTNYLHSLNVQIEFNSPIQEIITQDKAVKGFVVNGKFHSAPAIIIATGGLSYPRTGSTGDGFRWAAKQGHTIVDLKPSLIPLIVREQWCKSLAGLSLKNVELSVFSTSDKNKIAEETGEILFTHFGLSGPAILSLSRKVVPYLSLNKQGLKIEINLFPTLNSKDLDKNLQNLLTTNSKKKISNSLNDLLSNKLLLQIFSLAGLNKEKFSYQITKGERFNLGTQLQHFSLTITGTRPMTEAIVTSGGICVKELVPSTMESRLIKGLFFAGEVIDVDAYTGGYNLQAAFSTGYVAGKSAAKKFFEREVRSDLR
ncbi:NAD(P)/FAD-dependent oxidoreductase [Bacillota bacterium LX-D]|nr:NAD(P)/FAD-dependent oxidoreductase [Bacillota bacterium LX-D]